MQQLAPEPRSQPLTTESLLESQKGFVVLRDLTQFERIDRYTDNFPCLSMRCALKRLCASVYQFCVASVGSSVLEYLILLVIIVNTVNLVTEGSYSSGLFNLIESVCLVVYTVECVMKITAMGLVFRPHAYLRDPWNLLDFSIVITAWIEILVNAGANLSALRTLRVLRPLRSISSIRGIKIIVKVLISSMKPLTSTLTVLFFFCIVAAILGLQLWQGTLNYRCLDVDSGIVLETLCGARGCPGSTQCVKTLTSPNFGATNFNNIFYSTLTVFQLLTLEGWSEIMVSLQVTVSTWCVLYFIPLVLFGSLFLMNLTLAFIKIKFTDTIKHKGRGEAKKATTLSESNEGSDNSNGHVEDDNTGMLTWRTLCVPDNPNKKLKMIEIAGFPNTFKLNLVPTVAAAHSEPGAFPEFFEFGKVFEINECHSFAFTSKKEVLQLVPVVREPRSKFYKFSYNLSEVSSPTPALFATFLKETMRQDSSLVFYHLVQQTKSVVSETRAKDQRTLLVEGEWSGRDVDPDTEFSYFKLNQQNFPRFRGCIKLRHSSYIALQIAECSMFSNFITLCVLANTLVLSLDYHGISKEMTAVLQVFNLLFAGVFAMELVIKLYGYGPIAYFRDPMNYLDFLIVAMSVVELTVAGDSFISFSAFKTLRLFRTIRVLRVAKLFRYLEYMNKLLKVISVSLSISLYLALLLLIFTMVFALLGMQLFANDFNFTDGRPRANFDTFNASFITMFQVLSLENWNLVLYDGMRSSVGPFASFFFLLWIFIGNFILLNLFLAILLGSFTDVNEQSTEEDEVMKKMTSNHTLSYVRMNPVMRIARASLVNEGGNIRNRQQILHMCEELNDKDSMLDSDGDTSSVSILFDSKYQRLCERSWCVFNKNGTVRRVCYKLLSKPWMESVILILIILSSLKLVVETYLTEDLGVIWGIEVMFNSVFTLEFILKSVAYGFAFGKNTYMRDYWNFLDFWILVLAWTDALASSTEFHSLMVLRLIRTLRPLRFVSHNISMKVMINALVNSFLAIINVAIVVIIVWLIFSILAVSLYQGLLYSCEEPNLLSQIDCESYGYTWVRHNTNFDNVPQAMLTLYIISSLEGWPEIMYSLIDATEIGEAPKRNNNPAAAYLILAFIIIGSFFFLNLFIGVVFERFQAEKNTQCSMLSLFLTRRQKKWVELQRLILNCKPQVKLKLVPMGKCKKFLHKISTHRFTELAIFLLIAINMMQMALVYDEASTEYIQILDTINLVLTLIFMVEAIVKIGGFGLKGYFLDNWNKFDFFVAVTSAMEIVVSYSSNGTSFRVLRVGPQIGRAIRVVRVLKVFRLIKTLKDIQSILETIKYSIPSMLNVLSLLILFFFVYSILGVFLFKDVSNGQVISENLNFAQFHTAMITLFVISTGEEWHPLMYDCAQQHPTAAYLYFCSFSIFTTFIMINLFVMILLQSLDEHYENPESPIEIFNRTIKTFNELWTSYTNGVNWVDIKCLVQFLSELGPPLGFSRQISVIQALKNLASMNVPVDSEDRVFYYDLVYALYKRYFGNFRLREAGNKLRAKILMDVEEKSMKRLKELRNKKEIGRRLAFHSTLCIYYKASKLKLIFQCWRKIVLEKNSLNNF